MYSEEVIDTTEEENEDIFLYLWYSNKEIFDIYKILRNYINNENYSMDSAILLALIKDNDLPFTKTLTNIPYIHSGYLTVILPKADNNGRSEQESNTET